MDEDYLTRLREYRDYLDERISGKKDIPQGVTILETFARNGTEDAYKNSKNKLEELFPELK